MIQTRREDGVSILTMAHPKANAMSPEFVSALSETMRSEQGNDDVGAVVLASALPGIFCAGLDLKALDALDRPAMERFIADFSTLMRVIFGGRVPVVAAVEGHAVAGGCVLLLACERRVASAGSYSIHLPEVDLAVPLPAGSMHLLRLLVGLRGATEAALMARRYSPAEALAVGLVDRVVEPGTGFAVAVEEARILASKSVGALRDMRYVLRAEETRRLENLDAVGNGRFVDAWFSPAAKNARRAVLERLAAKVSAT